MVTFNGIYHLVTDYMGDRVLQAGRGNYKPVPFKILTFKCSFYHTIKKKIIILSLKNSINVVFKFFSYKIVL